MIATVSLGIGRGCVEIVQFSNFGVKTAAIELAREFECRIELKKFNSYLDVNRDNL